MLKSKPLINVYSKNYGWLFEDLKGYFSAYGAVVTDEPLTGADFYICIRKSDTRCSMVKGGGVGVFSFC